MTARSFLIRGLIAGLLAGIAAFVVAFTVGEPHVQAAIDVEASTSATHAHADSTASDSTASDSTASDSTASDEGSGHSHAEDGTVVSRSHQRTWGLLTATLGVGTALGGLVALVAAGVVGRLGRLRPGQSTALVALVGWVAVTLVPFVKYPASPPAVGDAETIGERTGLYFGYLLVSLIAAVVAVAVARRVLVRAGSYAAVLTGAGLYLVVVVVAGLLLPTVDEVGSFPASTLWSFRVASVLTTATMWAVIGIVLTGLVGRLHQAETATADRRRLAASL